MACHEIAALRLGLMEVLGLDDPQEKEHELQEIGSASQEDGPIQALMNAKNLSQIKRFFTFALVELQEKVSQMEQVKETKDLAYYNTLIVLTKKVEQDLHNQIQQLEQLYKDLDEIHHFVHELYPPSNS